MPKHMAVRLSRGCIGVGSAAGCSVDGRAIARIHCSRSPRSVAHESPCAAARSSSSSPLNFVVSIGRNTMNRRGTAGEVECVGSVAYIVI